MFMSFLKNKFTDAFVAKLGNRCFCWFPSAHPGEHQHGASMQISISLGKTFLRIPHIRNIPLT